MKNDGWTVYLLLCADGTFYCGVTTDIERRLSEHNSGRGARYTRGRRPVTLAAQRKGLSRSFAYSFEVFVKRLPRSKKLSAFMADGSILLPDLDCDEG